MKQFVLFVCLTALLGACTQQEQPAAAPADPQPQFQPTATIKDIMLSMVDPNADFIWESVATIINDKGIEERRPETDEEWAELRRRTVTLLEASNLLLINGRRVTDPAHEAEFPELELTPDEIDKLIKDDWGAWTQRAHRLHETTSVVLSAIDAKDADALLNAGEGIDEACEGCHIRYWYPKDSEAVRLYEERMKAQAK
jgi:hypothetical protein